VFAEAGVMRFSSKGRYATRLLAAMAMRAPDMPVTKQYLATSEGITPDYVAQIMASLKAAGLVVSQRGARGGFNLARAAADITVAEVIAGTEGPIDLAPCTDGGECPRASVCTAQKVWARAARAMNGVLENTTIADIATETTEMQQTRSLSFHI